MKILLAPSESKKSSGKNNFNPQTLLFETLSPQRMQVLHAYTNIIQKGDMEVLSKMFGIKKEIDISKYQKDIIHELSIKAIERYTGVAFDYLSYENLECNAQRYIDNNVILFSNLFGPIKASDEIPEYKLKQGEAVGEIKTEKFYHTHAAKLLDSYLQKEEILDLRAGFYNKFYKPSVAYTTVKFIKEGRVVSHWAKAYRGIVLREIAKAQIPNIKAFMQLEIENLQVKEIIEKGIHSEIVYDIVSG